MDYNEGSGVIGIILSDEEAQQHEKKEKKSICNSSKWFVYSIRRGMIFVDLLTIFQGILILAMEWAVLYAYRMDPPKTSLSVHPENLYDSSNVQDDDASNRWNQGSNRHRPVIERTVAHMALAIVSLACWSRPTWVFVSLVARIVTSRRHYPHFMRHAASMACWYAPHVAYCWIELRRWWWKHIISATSSSICSSVSGSTRKGNA